MKGAPAARPSDASVPEVLGEEENTVNSVLWHACAGPLVSLPPVSTLVYYFPQGHVEQVKAITKKAAETHIPNYPTLPSQILCHLHNVTLHADSETDEVYAEMTLEPIKSHDAATSSTHDDGFKQSKHPTDFFCKTLTASDTSTHGGFSVPRRAAEKVFPPLDYTAQPPAQELVARDVHNKIWTFRHIYRGQPKRHLLTTGWSVFVASKKLVAGDSILFVRDEKSQLLLGVRRAIRQQVSIPLSVLSSDNMHIGVLAAAAHASANRSPFTVFYNPRASPSEFVVSLSKYQKALCGTQLSLGMRFRMTFETEDSSVRRHMGTITGISDLDPVRWPNSQWQNLQVGWDESCSGEKPNRVSIWEIESVAAAFFLCPPFVSLKRPLLPGILGEYDELELTKKRFFPWTREENDILNLQNPPVGGSFDSWMGQQQKVNLINSNPAVQIHQPKPGASLQEAGKNDMSKQRYASPQTTQFHGMQNVSPLQDHVQAHITWKHMEQDSQNAHLEGTSQQPSMQPLQQSFLPGQLQESTQQNNILQKLQQQIYEGEVQRMLPQVLLQHSTQQKLQGLVQPPITLPSQKQPQQNFHQHAEQDPSEVQHQQLLSQYTLNQTASPLQIEQPQQSIPNLTPAKNQLLQEMPTWYNKESFLRVFQQSTPVVAQQRIMQMQCQRPHQAKQVDLSVQQVGMDQLGKKGQTEHHYLLSNRLLQNQQDEHKLAAQHSGQTNCLDILPFNYQQPHSQSKSQMCGSESLRLPVSSQLHSACSLLVSAKSIPELSQTDISFGSSSANGCNLQNFLNKPQIGNVSSDDRSSFSALLSSGPPSNVLDYIPDRKPHQSATSLYSSDKIIQSEIKAILNAFSSEVEKPSIGLTHPSVQHMSIKQSLLPDSSLSGTYWCGNDSSGNDLQINPQSNAFFGVDSNNNSANVSASHPSLSRDFNMVKDALGQFSAESVVSTSTTKDVQPQISSASILSSQSLGIQNLPDNSDVASTVEDSCLLQRARYQQPALPLRTYTKVYKLGSVGRSIDVTRFKNYDELRHELARLFGLEGLLEDPRKSGWQLVFVDHENDVLLVGDDPWEEFVSCVRCIKILSPQEVLQMSREGIGIIHSATTPTQ